MPAFMRHPHLRAAIHMSDKALLFEPLHFTLDFRELAPETSREPRRRKKARSDVLLNLKKRSQRSSLDLRFRCGHLLRSLLRLSAVFTAQFFCQTNNEEAARLPLPLNKLFISRASQKLPEQFLYTDLDDNRDRDV